MRPHALLALTSVISTLVLSGCNSDSDSSADDNAAAQPLALNILHINDHHSNLEESSIDLDIAGTETSFALGGFPRVAAKMAEREAELDNVLKLHAGDAITGTLYFSSFEGEADAALMNEVCFDAFALGNHEFNEGNAGLAKFLDFLNSGDCSTPVLAANIKPEVGVSALTPNRGTDYIQPIPSCRRTG